MLDSGNERFHIVILEDNFPDLVMIKRSVREAGLECEFTVFVDGAEAVDHVKDPKSAVPDLMILDLNVPRVEGPSVLNSVRSSPRWAQVGVFMFTASRDPGDIARVKLLGADQCLTKPMDVAGFARIGHAVRDWMENTKRRARQRIHQAAEDQP